MEQSPDNYADVGVGGSGRARYLRRKNALWMERSSWVPHWAELSRYILPRAGRFLTTDRNKGRPRDDDIYDNTGTQAMRVLASGLMAGMTSPARPWFRLTLPDSELSERHEVRAWLDKVSDLMRAVFNSSNTYRALHSMYEELAVFGTAAAVVLPNYENVIHVHPLTAGEYAIAVDELGRPNALYREFDMTVGQLVSEFGLENVSRYVRDRYERGQLDQWITVIHAIEERQKHDPKSPWAKDMRWASVYFEAKGNEDKFLRESGFKRFPVVAPRWVVTGGDIYGRSPGMEALGDIKQLQHQQLRKLQGIDYMVKPPLAVPPTMADREIDMLPGGVTFVDVSATSPIRSLFDVRLDLQALLLDIQDVRQRIQKTFYADLFLMMLSDDRSGITAREVVERHEEKLLMLGPVLERLFNELLDPLIDITFGYIVDAGILPDPPKVLSGVDIDVEFVSTLAQAQRAVGINASDRFVMTVAQLAQVSGNPGVWDRVDSDKVVSYYADALGVEPGILRDDSDVEKIRAERQKMIETQQKLAAAQQLADAAQKGARATVDTARAKETAGGDLTSLFMGYSGGL